MQSGSLRDEYQGAAPVTEARDLVTKARRLVLLGLAWHAVQATVAMTAGLASSSLALTGFGLDSLIESVAGITLFWRSAAENSLSVRASRRAETLVAAAFFALAAYLAQQALRNLFARAQPGASWTGIMLAALTLAILPPVAIGTARVARRLGSPQTNREAKRNLLYAFLAAALLLGLATNALMGWWWTDPLVAFASAGAAIREGFESLRRNGQREGESVMPTRFADETT